MWHFQEDGRAVGPIAREGIQGLINSGRIKASTMVWQEGMSSWMPADQTALSSSFPRVGPPPLQGPNYTGPANHPAFINAPGGFQGYSGMVFAGFWTRLAAYLIDGFIVGFAAVILFFVVGVIIAALNAASGKNAEAAGAVILGFGYLINLIGTVLYFTLFPAGSWQATPGKRLVGIHIIRVNGQKVNFGLAFGRYLSYIVSGIILYFGFFMIGWTDQKQGLHDMMCGTRVIYGKT